MGVPSQEVISKIKQSGAKIVRTIDAGLYNSNSYLKAKVKDAKTSKETKKGYLISWSSCKELLQYYQTQIEIDFLRASPNKFPKVTIADANQLNSITITAIGVANSFADDTRLNSVTREFFQKTSGELEILARKTINLAANPDDVDQVINSIHRTLGRAIHKIPTQRSAVQDRPIYP